MDLPRLSPGPRRSDPRARELAHAIEDGSDVRGYHSWSILDNFEWSEGYTQRFGMVFVDFPTRRRFIKDSGKWYSQLAASNTLDAVRATR